MRTYTTPLIAFIIGIIVSATTFTSLENSCLNLKFKLRGSNKIHPEIKLLLIDEKLFNTRSLGISTKNLYLYNHLFWNLNILDKIIKKLSSYEPKLITMLSASPYWEEMLAYTSKDTIISLEKQTRETPVIWSSYTNYNSNFITPPPPFKHQTIAFNNIITDYDQIVRRAKLQLKGQSSIALSTLNAFHFNKDALKNNLTLEEININFTHENFDSNIILASDFLKEAKVGWKSVFNKKLVLIGIKSTAQRSYFIPAWNKPIPDYIIQTEIINTILGNKILSNPSWGKSFIITFILTLLTILLFMRLRLIIAITITSLLAFTYFILTIILFSLFSISINLATPLIAMGIPAIILIIWKHNIEERQQTLRLQLEIEEIKGNFISLISHNLRTPIARIRALSTVIMQNHENLNKQQEEAISNILRSSRELNSYVANILNLTRIESRKFKLNKTSCDINDIIKECVDHAKNIHEDKDISFELDLGTLFSIELDRDLFTQIFFNLIENAIKYSPTKAKITIKTKEENDLLYLSFTDYGIGINKEDLEKIFKKFHRAKNIYTDTISGSGLGLYLAKYFVELHGGTIFVDSQLGEGSTFTITLPLS